MNLTPQTPRHRKTLVRSVDRCSPSTRPGIYATIGPASDAPDVLEAVRIPGQGWTWPV